MSANPSPTYEQPPEAMPPTLAAVPSKRDAANIIDAALGICHAIGFKLRRHSNIITALMGKAGGRDAFELGHLTLAKSMQYTGSADAARQMVRRELDALEFWQTKTGRYLFNINRGKWEKGKSDPETTAYEDFITPAAVHVVKLARADRAEWNKNPGKTISKYIAEGVKMLPQFKPTLINAPEPEGKPNAVLLRRRRRLAMEHLRGCFEIIASMDGADAKSFWLEFEKEGRERAGINAEVEARDLSHYTSSDDITCDKTESDEPKTTAPDASAPLFYVMPEKEAIGVKTDTLSSPEVQENQQDKISDLTETARAALLCAAESIPVFPCALDKKPLTPHGFKDATCDEATVRAWWKKYPDASVGIPTGAASGWFVVDVDPKSGGSESLAMLCEEFGEEWLDTLTQQTGSLGYHFIFEHDAGLNLRNSASKIAPGIDTRGEGGYIIFAPSNHPSGRRYRLINTREPQKMPEWLIEKLTAPVERRASNGARSHSSSCASFCEGGRNTKLFSIGCAMLARGELSEKIEAELFAVNAQSCKPPLADAEVWKIVGSVTSGRYVATVSEVAQ